LELIALKGEGGLPELDGVDAVGHGECDGDAHRAAAAAGRRLSTAGE
jgi:hypothetical protein